MAKVVEIFPHRRQRPFYFFNQYHVCWCPGALRRQGISGDGFDLVFMDNMLSTLNTVISVYGVTECFMY